VSELPNLEAVSILRLRTGYNHGLPVNLLESLLLASICDKAGKVWGVGTYTDKHCDFVPDTSCSVSAAGGG